MNDPAKTLQTTAIMYFCWICKLEQKLYIFFMQYTHFSLELNQFVNLP